MGPVIICDAPELKMIVAAAFMGHSDIRIQNQLISDELESAGSNLAVLGIFSSTL